MKKTFGHERGEKATAMNLQGLRAQHSAVGKIEFGKQNFQILARRDAL